MWRMTRQPASHFSVYVSACPLPQPSMLKIPGMISDIDRFSELQKWAYYTIYRTFPLSSLNKTRNATPHLGGKHITRPATQSRRLERTPFLLSHPASLIYPDFVRNTPAIHALPCSQPTSSPAIGARFLAGLQGGTPTGLSSFFPGHFQPVLILLP